MIVIMELPPTTRWPTLRGFPDRGDPYRRFLYRYHAMLDRWPAATTEHLDSRFGRTAVTVAGPADAPPLVLLHGAGATSTIWYALAGPLARRYRIFAVDRLGEAGLGGADLPIRTGGELVDWLTGVLDGCGVQRAAVAGHGSGGWLALRYALAAPDRVSALALLDPVDCFGRPRPGYRSRELALTLASNSGRARALVRWESAGVPVDEDWLELFAAGTGVPRQLPPRQQRPSTPELRAITAPVLIMLAGMSRVNDARRTRLAALRRMPAAEVAVIGHASHHSLPYQPAGEVAARLSGFLTRSGSSDWPGS